MFWGDKTFVILPVNYLPLKWLAFVARAGSLRVYAMHLIYQSHLALISYVKDCTAHGGLFLVIFV
jgi:hypothetical protein